MNDTKHQGTKAPSLIRMTRAEWLAEGERLFGPDMFQWRFVCPSCGHVQTIEDFRPHAANGATPESARYNCIGRYDGHMNVDAFQGPGTGPCNYTTDGLICISPIRVTDEAGTEFKCFDFDRAAEGGAACA